MLDEPPDDGSPVHLSVVTTANDGDPSWAAGEALVQGQPVPAVRHVEGALTVWHVVVQSVTVIAAAWQAPLDRLALMPVADLTPFKRRRALVVEQLLSRHPLT